MQSTYEHMPWINHKKGYLFKTQPIEINASPAIVWAYVKDPNHYYQYSDGAVWAHVDGPVAPQSPIVLKLFKDTWLGKLIPTSHEIISEVNDTNTTIGWQRPLPIGGFTERYQVLEPSDDGKKTISYIALKIPGPVGFFSKVFMKGTIEKSFKELNEGIQDAAEDANVLSI